MTVAAEIVQFTKSEARVLTDEVRHDIETTWEKVLNLHDRRAHHALGYSSWDAYIAAEFKTLMSRAQAYYLINQGRTILAIQRAASTSNALDISIRTATDLRPRLDEATAEIRKRVAAGEGAEVVVPEVVREFRSPSPPRSVGTDAAVGNSRTLGRRRAPTHILKRVCEQLDGVSDVLDGMVLAEIESVEAIAIADRLHRFRSVLSKTINQLRSLP